MASKLTITGGGVNLTAQFNPAEYSLSKSVKIEEQDTKEGDAAVLEFIRGNNQKLSFTLLFDSTLDGPDVWAQADSLYRATLIQGTAAPLVTVAWDDLSITGYLDSVERKFTLFNENGKPLRAMVTVAMREQAKERGESPHVRRRVVRRGDTLEKIAAEFYFEPGQWRRIADANADVVKHPRHLEPGTVLMIPPREL